ncbi:prolyl aminopeptidase [Nocardia sp. BMG51109]|uniref:prolyl aminopeptidase n=1 Tax=Nocardia sp. BMG51109 TaxID=1056816 RepID=UPI000463D197|nr:prolyl aminopeptidase [Nocardia sp. BMG51109]
MVDSVEVRASGLLAIGDGHEVYWEESGSADGIPAVYLHGGPGGGLGAGAYRNKFDPARFRIIGFDQRGCGRSAPHATAPGYDLSKNTTPDLIDDIERIREHLHVDRWLVNGASWGSTLALAYAQAHPARVRGIVLVAVTTTDRFAVDWITETVSAIYPEAWDRLATHAEQAGIGYRRGDGRIIEAYAQLMTHEDPAVRDRAARAWADWEDHHISIGSGGVQRNPRWEDAEFRELFATLVTHYWAHDGFLTPPILERMDRLHGIPATLIHGRRDVSSPSGLVWRLHRAWPDSELIIDEGGGHGGTAMGQAWHAANTRHADRLDAGPSIR